MQWFVEVGSNDVLVNWLTTLMFNDDLVQNWENCIAHELTSCA